MSKGAVRVGKSSLAYRISGITLITVGLSLLAAAGGYWIFAQVSKAGLEEQNVSVSLQRPDFPNTFEQIDAQRLESASAEQDESSPPRRIPTPEEYRPVDWTALPRTVDVLPRATWISIPMIGISAPIVELGTVWEDDKLVWERPINAVGHHRGTPNPGELGNVVMSGHRSSPIRGEGAVFRALGEVPRLLGESASSGESVDILLHSPGLIYIYRAVSTQVVKPEEVDVFRQTAEPTLTLITCTPDLVYSHRLILTAWLVATAPA